MDDGRTQELLADLSDGLSELTEQLEEADDLLQRGGDVDAVHAVIRRALGVARRTFGRVQDAVDEFRHGPLDKRDFAEAVEVIAGEGAVEVKAEVDGSFRGDATVGSGAMARRLLSVLEDAVTYFTEVGDADRLTVRLELEGECIRLTVSDEGTAFEPHEIGEEAGGLKAIRATVRERGGELALETSWREGTRLVVTLSTAEDSQCGEKIDR